MSKDGSLKMLLWKWLYPFIPKGYKSPVVTSLLQPIKRRPSCWHPSRLVLHTGDLVRDFVWVSMGMNERGARQHESLSQSGFTYKFPSPGDFITLTPYGVPGPAATYCFSGSTSPSLYPAGMGLEGFPGTGLHPPGRD